MMLLISFYQQLYGISTQTKSKREGIDSTYTHACNFACARPYKHLHRDVIKPVSLLSSSCRSCFLSMFCLHAVLHGLLCRFALLILPRVIVSRHFHLFYFYLNLSSEERTFSRCYFIGGFFVLILNYKF